VCVNVGPAAGLNVPPGWYRIDGCDEAHTVCAVTVFWQVTLVADELISLRYNTGSGYSVMVYNMMCPSNEANRLVLG